MLILITSLASSGGGRDIIKCNSIQSRETATRSLIALIADDATTIGEVDLFRERIEILPEPKP